MFNVISASTDRFLADLSQLEQRMVKDQRQVSSGLRLQTVSDDPDQVSTLLQLKARIAHNDQLKFNLGRVKTEVDSAENAINTATTLMDRARQIAAQGANGLTSVDTRTQLASEVGDLISEMYGLTQTQVEGRYVFSGSSDQTPPYASVDFTQPNSVGSYNGSNATRTVEHPNGSTFSVSLTAQNIFDGNGGDSSVSVLKALSNLRADLLSNDVNALQNDAKDIATSAVYLNGRQALYGDIQNQVADAIDFQNTLSVKLTQQLSNAEDADAPAAILQMQQDSVAQQAAMQAHIALPRKSLFDYLG